jgi:DnaJ-class molecular chaperone
VVAPNPSAALGAAPAAPHDEIRKAYRALAKKYHPDLNPGDSTAADRFKEISSAYGIVGDADKRKRFDAGEIDASGTERPQYHTYKDFADAGGPNPYASQAGFQDFEDVSDLFSDLFGRRGGGGGRAGAGESDRAGFKLRGQDVRYHLAVDFLDAVKGAKTRVTMPDGKTLDITIPEGTRDGQTLRLKGQGGPGYGGGPPGDAFVEIEVRPHPLFERKADDLLVEVPITIDEAVLGGRIEVPTVDGRVNLTVPKGSSSGRTLRLKGKGVKRASGGRGDQFVKLRIVLPETIDPELEAFMREWSARRHTDPRRADAGG